MTEREAALTSLRPKLRDVFYVIERHGPLSAPDLRKDGWVARKDPAWQGREGGMTDWLQPLLAAGLIRPTGKQTESRAVLYEATPVEEIEKAARRHQRQQHRPRPRNGNGRWHDSIADYTAQEKALGTLARARWIERRRHVVQLIVGLKRMEPMLFWRSVHDDEIARVYEEIHTLHEVAGRLLSALEFNRADAETRELIAKLRNVSGRELAEGAVYRERADELEARLEAEQDER